MKRLAILTIEAERPEQIDHFVSNFNVSMQDMYRKHPDRPFVKLFLEPGRLEL